MAIRRKAYVDSLDRLLGDLPKMVLEMNRQNEMAQIERDKMLVQQNASLAELELNVLAEKMQLTQQQMESDKAEIESIDQAFRQTTKNLPSYNDIDYTGAAEGVIEQVSDAEFGIYTDGINEKRNNARMLEIEANKSKTKLNQYRKDESVLDFLKADMSQNMMNIAAMGGDLNMFDTQDLAPYWDNVLLPSLAENNLITNDSDIERYKDVWMGMLSPHSNRLTQRAEIIKYKKDYINTLIQENNLIDIDRGYWDQLPYENKDEIITMQLQKVDVLLKPMIDNMNLSEVGTLIDKKTAFEQAKIDEGVGGSVGDMGDDWSDTLLDMSDDYQNSVYSLAYQIIGDLGDPQDITQEDMKQLYIDYGEELMKSILKATDSESAQPKYLLDVLEGTLQFTRNEHQIEFDEAGNMQIVPTGRQRQDNAGARALQEMLGLDPWDYDQGVLEGIIELYRWSISKQGEAVLDSFQQTPSKNESSSMMSPSEIPLYNEPGQNSSFGVAAMDRGVDESVAEIIQEAKDDWII